MCHFSVQTDGCSYCRTWLILTEIYLHTVIRRSALFLYFTVTSICKLFITCFCQCAASAPMSLSLSIFGHVFFSLRDRFVMSRLRRRIGWVTRYFCFRIDRIWHMASRALTSRVLSRGAIRGRGRQKSHVIDRHSSFSPSPVIFSSPTIWSVIFSPAFFHRPLQRRRHLHAENIWRPMSNRQALLSKSDNGLNE